MIPLRFLPLISMSVVLAGCGTRAGVSATPTSTHPSAVGASHHILNSQSPPVTTPAPANTPGPAATPAPQPPVESAVLVVESPESDGAYAVSLVNATGHALATAHVANQDEWTVTAARGGAYWMDGGRVKLLASSGAVSDVGSVPRSAGELLVSPDGSAYAYDTNTAVSTTSAVTDNRIVVQVIGGASRVIADRLSDPSHPVRDAPQQWMYGLMSWTAQGILFRREVTGTCGCQAFDMDMIAGFTGIIDPGTEIVTDLTADSSCPLTALGSGLAAGCFHINSSGGADSLRVLAAGTATSQFTLSGQNAAGYGVFSADGATLAYETVPTANSGCGSASYPTTLHLLTIASGAVHATPISGLHAKVWPAGGLIYGDLDTGSGAAVVTVDPTTMALHQVLGGASGTRFVGLN